MTIPDFQALMLPVLKLAEAGPIAIAEVVARIEDQFDLSDEERSQFLPSGKQTTIANRTHWAASYLSQAGLIERPKRGVIVATEQGTAVLAGSPERIDRNFLTQFEAFQEFASRTSPDGNKTISAETPTSEDTPDETIRRAHRQIQASLADDLLSRIQSSPPVFFEDLIVDLLVRMGYGSGENTGQAIGKSGDDGVDGVINLDALGVDQVYFQAKRYQPGSSIGAGQLRDFFGALAMKDVTKGIFVTTSHFTPSARDTADKLSKRIVLIDGPELARLMIRHNVGCRVVENFPISTIDESYFE